MPNEHPMMSREEYARRFPDEGEPRSVERLTDEELARHASRAYQLAAQHGEDQWIAVARMMRVQLSGDGTPPSDGLYTRLMDIIGERFPETQVQSTLRSRIAYLMQQVEVSRGRAEPGEGERREIKEARPE